MPKYQYLLGIANTRECESLLWKIEDHPLNIDGKDVGNINSSHLIEYNNSPTAQDLYEICKNFYSIFPISDAGKINIINEKKVLNALLFTSWKNGKEVFWDERILSNYILLNFDNMRKIIRGKAKKGNADTSNNVFKTFIQAYVKNQEYTFLKQEEVENNGLNLESVDKDNILGALCWYASRKGEVIWKQGKYFAVNCTYEDYKSAPKGITNKDWYFPNVRKITNIKAGFNGGNPQFLDAIN